LSFPSYSSSSYTGRYLPGPGYICLLGGLITAAEQNYDLFPGIFVIHPIAGAVINAHFGDFPEKAAVSGVSIGKPVYPDKDTGYDLGVFELAKPFVEFACFAYSHIDNVDYNPQKIKGSLRTFTWSGAYGNTIAGAVRFTKSPSRFH
jgi:hypothetical protein